MNFRNELEFLYQASPLTLSNVCR